MKNLDSILKSRDITLPAKVSLVKAIFFPVIMYGCESWTLKKAECQITDDLEHQFKSVGEDWCWKRCWRRLLRVLGLQGDHSSQS